MQNKRLSKLLCVIVFVFGSLLSCELIFPKTTNNIFATEVEYTKHTDLTIISESVYDDYLVAPTSGNYVYRLFDDFNSYNLTGDLFDVSKVYAINYDACLSNCSTLVDNGINSNQLLMFNMNANIAQPYIVVVIDEYDELNGNILNTFNLRYNVIFEDSGLAVFFVGYTDTTNNYQSLNKSVYMKNNILSTEQFLSGDILSYNFEVLNTNTQVGDSFLCLIDKENAESNINHNIAGNILTIDITPNMVSDIFKITILLQRENIGIVHSTTFYMSGNFNYNNICSIQPKAFYMQDVNASLVLPMRIIYDNNFDYFNTLKQVWRVYPTVNYQQNQVESYPIALEQKGAGSLNLSLTNLQTQLYPDRTDLPSLTYTVSLSLYDAYSNMVYYADTQLPISQNKTSAEYVVECINQIGDVVYTQACIDKIEYVEQEYLLLTELEKTQVTNYIKLSSARKSYNNLLLADQCMSKITNIGVVTYNAESLIKIISAEEFYSNLTSEQKGLVDNSELLQTARNTYNNLEIEREANIENSVNSIALDCADTVILYLEEQEYASNQSFTINATGSFDDFGLICEWYLTSNSICEYVITGNSISIMPFNSGECDLIALYKFKSGKTLCKSIVIKVLENAPSALIKIKKDGNDAFNIYDILQVSASYDCDYSFNSESYCKWYIDEVLLEDITDFSFNKTLTAGTHKLKVFIYEFLDSLPKSASTEIFVHEVKDVEKTLTLSYTGEIFAYLEGGEFDVYAYIDTFKDNSYIYSWSIGDATIVNYAYEHLNRNYVILNPMTAGVTKLYVMVDVGVHDSKILVCELIINVFDNIETFAIDGISNYCKPNTNADFKLLVNGGSEIVNITPIWEVYRDNQKLDITNNSNLLNFNFDVAGKYVLKVSYADVNATVELNCASVDINTVLISLVPFCVIVAFFAILIWVAVKRKKDNLLVLKEDFEALDKAVSKFITNITDYNKVAEKLQNKCNLYSLGLLIRLKELRIKTENISLENMIEVESVYKKIDDAILTIAAFRNNIKNYKNKHKLIKVFEVLLNSNIKGCTKLLQEKLEVKRKFIQQISGNISSVGVKVFEKTKKKKHKVSQKEYEAYLKQKNCYYADDGDD